MIGILIYVFFLAAGFIYADIIFKRKDLFFRAWMGGVFGNVILMAGIVLPALCFGFTILSHVLLMVLSLIPAALYTWFRYRKGSAPTLPSLKGERYVDPRIFAAAILPISLIIWALLTNHVLVPYEAGGYASGQCTYGDLQMHLSFITSIAEQKAFPPAYNLLEGTRLNYPFFVDMLSSSLYLFGTPLRWAVLVPSYVIALLIVLGFYILAYSITKKQSAAVIAVVLFFIGGGFGFAYFMNGAKADHTVFTKIFTEYYKTPTNFNENNIRWSNPICDMIIPQRTTMAGWCTVLPALWMLIEALRTNDRRIFVMLGVFAGCMPMIHTHSFLALGIISAALLVCYAFSAENKKEYFINWAIFGGITVLIAFPQLFYWTFSQTEGNSSFLQPHFNWVNDKDPYLWFYLKNLGIIALFAVPAILHTSSDNKRLLCGCGLILVISELVLFQPNPYDNNKLLYIAFMILVIIVAEWLIYMWELLRGKPGRIYLAVIVLLFGNLSGALTIAREYNSGGEYQTFNNTDIAAAEFIKENTAPDAVFLTGTHHLNPVCTLAGRTVYCGSSLYVHFHGLGDEYAKRSSEIKAAYSGSYDTLRRLCIENDIEYIYVSRYEKGEYNPKDSTFSQLEKVYDSGGTTIYRISG